MSDTEPPQPPNAQPLRPVTLWLPDTLAPDFAAEARRQSIQVAEGADEDHILSLLEDDIGWADN